jgi:hypothetical protein
MKRSLWWLCVASLLGAAGCVDTVGPFVRDVTRTPSGDLRVTRCTIEFHRGFGPPSMEDGTCTTETR